VVHAKECLDMAQRAVLESHGSAASLLQERECLHQYVSISKAEEAFLKQKARNQWLQLGDQNSAFFHRLLKGRHARNTITHFCDEHGNRVEEVNQIKGLAEEFYKKLLGTSQMGFSDEFATRITHLISPIVPAESAALLEKPVTAEEIKKTMFSMPLNKAPGPDGFTTEFFKSSWSVVGEDVVAAIQSFLSLVCCLKN